MDPNDMAALDAIRKIFSQPPGRVSPTAFVRHDTLTGRAYADLKRAQQMLDRYGMDGAMDRIRYESAVRAAGLWPADLLPAPPVRHCRRWSRRGWRVIVGRGA